MGITIIVILGLTYMGLFVTMLVQQYKIQKAFGPLPWECNYDNARINRVEREKRQKIGEHKVEIELDDYV
jgi:hypothetical protein